MKWYPIYVKPNVVPLLQGRPIEADTHATAMAIAEAQYGNYLVNVRSDVSVHISDEELAVIERNRRREEDMA